MQNTFSQSGNDSKWFSKKSYFRIGMWHSRPPRDPPPFMANAILNFYFDFLTTSLIGIGIFYNNAHPQQYFRDRRTKTEKGIQFITFLLWFLQYTKRSFLTVHIGTITLQVGWLSQSTCTNTYLHVYFESPPNGLNFLQCTRFLLSRNVCSCRML